MTSKELAVDVRGLRKRYGNVTAVDGIDLGIRKGEVFGLLGPNGAGKSTTVEILQGHRSRDAGEVSVLGADPAAGTRAWRSRVGIGWQDEPAPAELTVLRPLLPFLTSKQAWVLDPCLVTADIPNGFGCPGRPLSLRVR
jgi:ABC-2 type transport system ATP-binding protein